MKRKSCVILALLLLATMSSCSAKKEETMEVESTVVSEMESMVEEAPETVKPSPDKYTWYVKNYVGKNCASIGYTSLGGERLDEYGDGYLKLIFISSDGAYVDVSSDDTLKKYVVIGQNLPMNTELKYTYETDEDGNEYDYLIESQSFEEIELTVQSIGESTQQTKESVSNSEEEKPQKTSAKAKTEQKEEPAASETDIRPEFKEAMDSYEEFFDEYVEIMNSYTNNPSDMSILTQYLQYMGQYTDMMEKFDAWEDEEMTEAETKYYLEVQLRIQQKLLEVL